MRLNESIVVAARPQLVWDYIADPANALHFMSGITRWEVEGETRIGLGARYRMLMRVGSAEMGGLVEIVEFRTRVEFRFAYGVAGAGLIGYLSERVAAPSVRRHLRESLVQLKREVEHEQQRQDAARRQAEREAATA